MAIAYVKKNSATGKAVSLTTVSAGSLIVAMVQWQDIATTPTLSDATNSPDGYSTVVVGGGDQRIRFAYWLSSPKSGTVTYTWTSAGGGGYTSHVFEMSTNSGPFLLDTVDAGASGTTGLTWTSASETSTQDPMVAFGGGGNYANNTAFSSATLDGTAVDQYTSALDSGYGAYGAITMRVMSNPGTYSSVMVVTGSSYHWATDLIAFKETAAAGGTSHPYTGGVGDGAITLGGATQRSRGIVRELGGSQAYSAGTVRARGRAPVSGGTRVFSAGSTYSNATLYIYTGGGAQAYGAASEYFKAAFYAYVGQGVIVFSDGSEHALGKVYTAGGSFVFSGGAVYVKTTGPRAYSYTGLSTGAIVYTGATVYFKTAYVSTARQVESKPGQRTVVMEAVPQRPAAQDGAYTDPAQDGIWDEYPVDGAYTRVGYEPEMKPPRRATPNMEGKPN